MNLKPFGKNILIEPVSRAQVLLSEQGALCEYGKVMAIGDEVSTIKVGDNLGFLVWGVQKLEVEDKSYYFIPENSDFILCTLED